MNYRGTIIEESLKNKDFPKGVVIFSTKVEPVTEGHKTPWLKQWTLHAVGIPEDGAESVAEKLSKSLDDSHPGAWYADFKSDTTHYIIFPDKIFRIDRTSKEEYAEATAYGISIGIPVHQVDFARHVKKWER